MLYCVVISGVIDIFYAAGPLEMMSRRVPIYIIADGGF